MSKKKIISLCLVVCLLATAIGGTLAYFTDTDSEKNTFTVGNVDIEVSETNKIDGVDVTGNAFADVMPGSDITKTAVVTNNSSEDAYVRVVVRINNELALNTLLDIKKDDGSAKYPVNTIFDGWDFSYDKVNGMRYTSTRTPGTTNNVQLIAVDEAVHSFGSGRMFISSDNYFMTDAEKNLNVTGFSKDEGGRTIVDFNKLSQDVINNASTYMYYQDLVGVYKDEGVAWVYYLKMAPNSSYTLFNGFDIPTDFDSADDMAFFANLEINVCADAIQSTGFTDAKAAFEELNKAHPLSAWNLGARD